MFQVLAPVTIHPTAEARQALKDQLRSAGKAAWREIARHGQGLEFAYLQFSFNGVTLALCSRLRPDGIIAIEIGLGDARQAARIVTAVQFRRAEAGGGTTDEGRAVMPMLTRHPGLGYQRVLSTNPAAPSIPPRPPSSLASGCAMLGAGFPMPWPAYGVR